MLDSVRTLRDHHVGDSVLYRHLVVKIDTSCPSKLRRVPLVDSGLMRLKSRDFERSNESLQPDP